MNWMKKFIIVYINNHYMNVHVVNKQLHSMIQDPVRNLVVLQPKIWNSDVMYPRYLFDSGLTIHLQKQIYTR